MADRPTVLEAPDHQNAGAAEERRLPAGLLWIGIALAVVAFTIWIVWVARHRPQLWSMLDLEIYRDGGLQLRTDNGLYVDNYSWIHLPFTYPPFSAGVFAVASYLSFAALKFVMTVGGVVSLLVVSWLSLGKLGYRPSAGRAGATLAAASVALWMEPVQQTLAFGQVNLILMLVVMIDLCLPDRFIGKGVGVGLAAGFKLTPAIFIPYLLLTKRFRAAGVAIATVAVTVGGSFLVMPHEARQYWGGLFFDSARVGGVDYVGNQSLHGMVTRLLRNNWATNDVWMLSVLVVAVVGLLLAMWMHRSGYELMSIFVTAVTGLLCSPISWSHHWVWITVGLILAADWAYRSRKHDAILFPVGLIVLFGAWLSRQTPKSPLLPSGIIWQVPFNNNAEYHWQGIQILQGDMYTYLALLFLLALVVQWRKSRRIVVEAPAGASGSALSSSCAAPGEGPGVTAGGTIAAATSSGTEG